MSPPVYGLLTGCIMVVLGALLRTIGAGKVRGSLADWVVSVIHVGGGVLVGSSLYWIGRQ